MSRRFRVSFIWAVLVGLLLVALAPRAGLAQVEVSAAIAERSVYVGQPVTLQVSVNGSPSPAEPVWPRLDGIDVQPRGGQNISHSSTVIINGRRQENHFEGYIFTYQVVFQRSGLQTIPALSVTVDGQEYHTSPLTVSVREPQSRSDVRLRLEVDNTSPYVGEAIELRATLYLSATIQNVSIRMPGLDGRFETYDSPDAAQFAGRQATIDFLGSRARGERGQATLDGNQYDTFTVRRLIVPVAEGEFELGPATLSCEVIVRPSRSFFEDDQVERVSVPSNAIRLNVKPLPAEGRPANFSGLIGRYRISAAASAADVNVGDPITLTIRIGADGAVLRDPRIDLAQQPGFRDQFRITPSHSEPERRNGQLIYEEVIRPLRDSVTEIPAIELPYFDIETGQYAVASSNAIPLQVRPTRIVTAGDAVGAEEDGPMGSDLRDAAGGIEYNYGAAESLIDQRFVLAEALESPVWIAALGAPPALYFSALMMLMWRKRGRGDESIRRRRRALGAARRSLEAPRPGESVADQVGAALRQYMADRFDQPAAGLTTSDCVILLEPIDASLARRLDELLHQCDEARYSGAARDHGDEWRAEALSLLVQIDRATARREEVAA